MKNINKNQVLYWVPTGILGLFILSGVFFINSEVAIEGTRHLGLPEWFRWEASIGSFIGGLILVWPRLPKWLKEWNYVALGIVYVSALIAHLSVDGFVLMSFAPVVTFVLLVTSYVYYHKLNK